MSKYFFTIAAKLVHIILLLILSLPQVLNILEITSVVFVLIYLYYASKQRPMAWIFGIIASVLSAVYFWQLELIGSAVLQLFYILQGLNGFFTWLYFESDRKASYRYSLTYHSIALLLLLLISVGVYWMIKVSSIGSYQGYNYFDILFALGSIWATQLETKKDVVCWDYWIACNLGYTAFYIYQSIQGENMFFYSALMLLLAVFSYWARKKWMAVILKEDQLQTNTDKHES